jgi:hypothetical protein
MNRELRGREQAPWGIVSSLLTSRKVKRESQLGQNAGVKRKIIPMPVKGKDNSIEPRLTRAEAAEFFE